VEISTFDEVFVRTQQLLEVLNSIRLP